MTSSVNLVSRYPNKGQGSVCVCVYVGIIHGMCVHMYMYVCSCVYMCRRKVFYEEASLEPRPSLFHGAGCIASPALARFSCAFGMQLKGLDSGLGLEFHYNLKFCYLALLKFARLIYRLHSHEMVLAMLLLVT